MVMSRKQGKCLSAAKSGGRFLLDGMGRKRPFCCKIWDFGKTEDCRS